MSTNWDQPKYTKNKNPQHKQEKQQEKKKQEDWLLDKDCPDICYTF